MEKRKRERKIVIPILIKKEHRNTGIDRKWLGGGGGGKGKRKKTKIERV